jgi:hypothetical protein
MPKEDGIEMQGEVQENLPNATFRVKLEERELDFAGAWNRRPLDDWLARVHQHGCRGCRADSVAAVLTHARRLRVVPIAEPA